MRWIIIEKRTLDNNLNIGKADAPISVMDTETFRRWALKTPGVSPEQTVSEMVDTIRHRTRFDVAVIDEA